jgi:hypothetical protein
MLKRIAFIASAVAAPMLMPATAHAQAAGTPLIVYGQDKCPTNDNGEEIVVCQRLDESERFRDPLRAGRPGGPPQKTESWAVRQEDALQDGNFGTGSCSAVGAGGGTGCFVRNATKSKAEAKARKKEQTALPLP